MFFCRYITKPLLGSFTSLSVIISLLITTYLSNPFRKIILFKNRNSKKRSTTNTRPITGVITQMDPSHFSHHQTDFSPKSIFPKSNSIDRTQHTDYEFSHFPFFPVEIAFHTHHRSNRFFSERAQNCTPSRSAVVFENVTGNRCHLLDLNPLWAKLPGFKPPHGFCIRKIRTEPGA